MELSGEYLIPVPVAQAWAALNDAAVLRACIPGCESLERISDTEMTATVVQKIGPVSARFTGKVTLSEINAPNSYRITGQGSGGVAGFAKGSALVRLAPVEGGTRLTYSAEAAIGGKIAQLGSRMIKGVANAAAGQFFSRFAQVAGATGQAPTMTPALTPAAGAGRGNAELVGAMQVLMRPASASASSGGNGVSWRVFALAGWSTAAALAGVTFLLAAR